MRGLIVITTLMLATPAAFARDQSMLARVTVYWAGGGNGSDHYTRQHKCATGVRLRTGHCAVDPHHIPYGSRVVLADGTSMAAVDTGTAVKNRKAARKAGRTPNERNAIVVDRFFETKSQALTWAKTHPLFMPVRVVAPNSRPIQQPNSALAFNSAAPIMKEEPATRPAVSYPLIASSNSSVVRNPLNKLGR